MGLVSWIIFGAFAGWVASIIVGNNGRQGCLGNILVGVIGAFIGGFVADLLGANVSYESFSWTSFGVAVLGAVLLLSILGSRRKR